MVTDEKATVCCTIIFINSARKVKRKESAWGTSLTLVGVNVKGHF
jgi:hypothetical protein